jgi:hypothetical protein
VDRNGNAIGISEHVVVPEAEDAVAFSLYDPGSRSILVAAMLSAIYLDDDLVPMARKVGDEITDRYLEAEAGVRK